MKEVLGIIAVIFFVISVIGVQIIIEKNEKAEKEKAEKERKAKEAKKELREKYFEWWINSKYNEFEVVKKYTAMLLKDRYRNVIKQISTGRYQDLLVDVTTYYESEEGEIFKYRKAQIYFCSLDGSLEAFNKETGSDLTYADLTGRPDFRF
jgi:hypothetical protein